MPVDFCIQVSSLRKAIRCANAVDKVIRHGNTFIVDDNTALKKGDRIVVIECSEKFLPAIRKVAKKFS